MEPGVRGQLEAAFGAGLDGVRVHTGRKAARAARRLGAAAFTVGDNIFFGRSRYAPGSTDGRRLLAHETAHVLQQRGAGGFVPRAGRRDEAAEREAHAAGVAVARGEAFQTRVTTPAQVSRDEAADTEAADADLLENPYNAGLAAEEFARLTLSVVKDPILAALRRHDSIEFLRRLRQLDNTDRALLLADTAFLDEVHRYLRGTSYWMVLLILRYGRRARPDYVRQLLLAVTFGEWQTVRDLIRAFPELRNPHIVPGVRRMLDEALRGRPEHDGMLAIFDQRATAWHTESGTYREVHYEQPEGGGAYALERFTGITRYSLTRTASELRVVVRIRLVPKDNPTETYYPEDARRREWRNAIEENWNNRFRITNGTTRLRVVFVPVFTESSPHHTVEVDPSEDYVRSSEHMWWARASGLTVAHEFGHMIGNPDEYRLPGGIAEIGPEHGLTVAEELRSSVEGITGIERPRRVGGHTLPGIMGSKVGGALPRHAWPVVAVFNAHLLQAGETPFRLE